MKRALVFILSLLLFGETFMNTTMVYAQSQNVVAAPLPDAVKQLIDNETAFREKAAAMRVQKEKLGLYSSVSLLLQSSASRLSLLSCGEPPPPSQPTSCVSNCSVRFSDGSCGNYARDFCAPDASCVPNCTVRFSNGSCGNYAADFCGSGASCSPNCTVRFSDGSCGNYGPDVCY